MLTGTTAPTTGTITTKGRVAALLELGMGFHSEFTGRQNAYMAGQLLGMSASQMDELMPEIEAFAGIGNYIDQAVRVYSSGMQVRLAFSIATAIRPDILIVDEALAVGDIEFQHRSFDRIRRFQKQGTTLLFVSHDKQLITSICDHAILLDGGKIAFSGESEAVMDYYNAMLADHAKGHISQTLDEAGKIQTRSGSGEVSLVQASIHDLEGQILELVRVGQLMRIVIQTQCQSAIDSLVAGFMIKDRLGQVVFGTNTFHHGAQLGPLAAGQQQCFTFELPANIAPGSYSLSVALHADDQHISKNYLWLDRVCLFTIIASEQPVFVGSHYLPVNVKVD
jgi:lipopolysaccharide transport system ATP-binding protein